ncbi:hypothetical protein AVEN_52535-1 [Araneus ventricosus]|uniref:Uncharacterized protein n=1 Tax=Araneus ventricosus TaxID=182803 RepID=A0A4Y2HGF6_ARAVE|nr:hypothetical protein AVEN_52535-1 [Araneus ventricosus]
MDSSAPFPLFSSLCVVGDMNGGPFISHLSPKGPFNATRPTAFSPLSEQQPAKIRPISIEVAWPVTAGLGVKVLIKQMAPIVCKVKNRMPDKYLYLIKSLVTLMANLMLENLYTVKYSLLQNCLNGRVIYFRDTY